MRALLLATLLLLGAVAILPSAVEARPPILNCGPVYFDPNTGNGSFSCGPYWCEFGVSYSIRCFG